MNLEPWTNVLLLMEEAVSRHDEEEEPLRARKVQCPKEPEMGTQDAETEVVEAWTWETWWEEVPQIEERGTEEAL